jgi:hypothetical protein
LFPKESGVWLVLVMGLGVTIALAAKLELVLADIVVVYTAWALGATSGRVAKGSAHDLLKGDAVNRRKRS